MSNPSPETRPGIENLEDTSLGRRFTRRYLLKTGTAAFAGTILATQLPNLLLAYADNSAPGDTSPIPTTDKDGKELGLIRADLGELQPPPDVPINLRGRETGHFYTQTRGDAKEYVGYMVLNNEQAPMWSLFNQLGGFDKWGYPVSNTWVDELGRVNQAFQKGIIQAKGGGVEFANIYDQLRGKGLNLDNPTDLVPPYMDWSTDTGRDWSGGPGSIQKNHIDTVFGSTPAKMKQLYLANPDWFNQYGLPMGVKDYGNVISVVCQRTDIQLWKDPTPWTNNQPNGVVFSNGGDVAKKFGLIPVAAAKPDFNQFGSGGEVPAPQPPVPAPEAPAAAFPREIGDLQRDGVVIHNRGTRIGVIDNREDPQNNWQAVVAVARQYAPNDKFEFFFYDNPNDVPQPETLQTPYKYDPVWYWKRDFPEADQGRVTIGRAANGVWQYHLSLPFVRPENQNKLSRNLLLPILAYSYKKEDLFAKSPSNAAAISRQQALDPYNSGRMNFSLKVVNTQ